MKCYVNINIKNDKTKQLKNIENEMLCQCKY